MASFQGKTGKWYQYASVDVDNLKALPLQGGNFVFARSTSLEGPVIIYAGEGDSLRSAFTPELQGIWQFARDTHSANMILINAYGASPAERQKELADLLEKHLPPMNVDNAGRAAVAGTS
jgi:hypothetical protein